MAGTPVEILSMATEMLESQDAELIASHERQYLSVTRKSASGSGNIDAAFGLDKKYRLAFVRCHFVGGAGTAPLSISLDSGLGAAFDTRLFTLSQAGTTKDVNLRIADGDVQDPSSWTFQSDDLVRVQWTNPDSGTMSWGLEVGLALAS